MKNTLNNDDLFSFSRGNDPDGDDIFSSSPKNTPDDNDIFSSSPENPAESDDIFSSSPKPAPESNDIFSNAPEVVPEDNGFMINDGEDSDPLGSGFHISGLEDGASGDELFSYTTDNGINNGENVQGDPGQDGSFGLESFSSKDEKSEKQGKNGKKDKKKDKKKSRSTKQKILRVVLSVFLIGFITVSIVAGTFIVYVMTSIDGTMEEDLDDLKLNFTTTIYYQDANGNWQEYQRLHGEYNRIWVNYDPKAAKSGESSYQGIPQNLVDAFVSIEDKRFYEHDGVDWKRTVSAFANLFLHFYSSNQGGSTVTQQLVKNLTGDNAQKPSRKMREIMRARYLESHYSKDTIIECYLNTIPMGNGIYGVEVAANYYFNKSVKDLTLLECASLAAITKAPSYYAPDENPKNNKDRRETVLDQMKMQGYITDKEYKAALKEDFQVTASKDALKEAEINNYYVDALISQVTKDIAKKYGYDETHASNMFYSGGYKIYSTVNPEIQAAVDETFTNSERYASTSSDGQQLQGSITVMDYEGHVVGMSGGIGEKTANMGFNRATSAVRQPGSTMKPIAAYTPAVESGIITYSTIVNDTATNYGNWKPVNWYGSYWGNISVRYALERSVNTIPVWLVNKMGAEKSYNFLTKSLGITTLNDEDKNLSALGMGGTSGGLTTMESAAAYAIFGNGGKYYEPKFYYSVKDQHGDVILSNEDATPTTAIGEDTATVMNHLLQNVVYGANGTGGGAGGYIPNMRIFAKTGTSDASNDLWFVGGSPYYVASCWCGYDNMATIRDQAIAQKMWGAVMSRVHENLPAKNFSESKYTSMRYFCTETGELATDKCTSVEVGWYVNGKLPDACKTHEGTVLYPPGSEEEKKAKEEAEKKKKEEEEKKKEEDKEEEKKKPEDEDAPNSPHSSGP